MKNKMKIQKFFLNTALNDWREALTNYFDARDRCNREIEELYARGELTCDNGSDAELIRENRLSRLSQKEDKTRLILNEVISQSGIRVTNEYKFRAQLKQLRADIANYNPYTYINDFYIEYINSLLEH